MTNLKAVVAGGSVGGLAAAHALLKAGCDVTVFERASSINPAGAGLGLDPTACAAVASFGVGQQLEANSLPMSVDIHSFFDATNAESRLLYRDDDLSLRSAHWVDLHRVLLNALPDGIVHFGHTMTGFEDEPGELVRVFVTAGRGDDKEEKMVTADFLIAADGSMSSTRAKFVPGEKRRYSGYVAWRGVMDADHAPEVVAQLKERYPELGTAIYFDIAPGQQHSVLYQLHGGRLNWLWYRTRPEPELVGHSVTVVAGPEDLEEMRAAADVVFPPPLAALIKVTPAPFINAIFDREPLSQFVWGRVALLGEAAHPTTPHGLRSTNMALADAAELGRCFAASGSDVATALSSYEELRVPSTAREVLFSRYLGQLRQGLRRPMPDCPPGETDWRAISEQDVQAHFAMRANMSGFDHEAYCARVAALPVPSPAEE